MMMMTMTLVVIVMNLVLTMTISNVSDVHDDWSLDDDDDTLVLAVMKMMTWC